MTFIRTLDKVVHPFLFGMFPALFIYANSIEVLPVEPVLLTAVLMIGAIFALQVTFAKFLKDAHKAGILISLATLLFFSYGYFQDLNELTHFRHVFFRHRFLLTAWLAIMASGSYLLINAGKGLVQYTRPLNLAALLLVTIQVAGIAINEFRRVNFETEENTSPTNSTKPLLSAPNIQKHPDIYYIILDEYAEESVLRSIYGYENRPFLSFLEEKGFVVVPTARSNYATTFLSLASSLNMQHLLNIPKEIGKDSQDKRWPISMILNNKVVRFLRANGYKYIHFDSGWDPTRRNPYADINYPLGGDRIFLSRLGRSTILRPVIDLVSVKQERVKILEIFEKLAEQGSLAGPKFVFAHFLLPHPPFRFKANGDPTPNEGAAADGMDRKEKDKYLEQLKFANMKVKRLVTELLARSGTPPVIVIQSDHGSASSFDRARFEDHDEVTDTMLKERMSILNAYYLPGEGRKILYESITPVNTFCLIFKFYLGADCATQADESYYSNYDSPYRFLNATRRIHE